MLNRWVRIAWRYLEPSLAQLVWLDPSIAAACWSAEPPALSVSRECEPRSSRASVVPREELGVA